MAWRNKLINTLQKKLETFKKSLQKSPSYLFKPKLQLKFLAWSDLCRRHHEEVLMNDLAKRKSNFPCNDVWQNVVVVLGPQKFSSTVVSHTQWPYLVWHSLEGGSRGTWERPIIKCCQLFFLFSQYERLCRINNFFL